MNGEESLAAKVEATIANHLAENGGGFVGPWVLMLNYTDNAGGTSWTWAFPDGQDMFDTMGLAEWLRGIVAYEQRRYLDEEGL